MRVIRSILFLLLLAGFAGSAAAQDFSVYAGRNKTLYDSRYYDPLFGDGVAPCFNTIDFRLGWTDYTSPTLQGFRRYGGLETHPTITL